VVLSLFQDIESSKHSHREALRKGNLLKHYLNKLKAPSIIEDLSNVIFKELFWNQKLTTRNGKSI